MRHSTLAALAAEAHWIFEFLPQVLPADVREVERAGDGAYYRTLGGLGVIASGDIELDGKRWLHVSVSRAHRLPSWEDLRAVKDLFIGRERTAYQVLPRAEKYVNINPHVLHMWCCLDGDPLPDFTRGGSTI